MPIRGLIFDLDGTLVDSKLDFDLMRSEMGIPHEESILEAIERMEEAQAALCRAILHRHEEEGAGKAVPMPGIVELLEDLSQQGFKLAVLTRNRRTPTLQMLQTLPDSFHPILTREDVPPKPDPLGIHAICEAWGLSFREVAMVGDYRFDLEAGRNAGSWTVLYTAGEAVEKISYAHLADYHFPDFTEREHFFSWLLKST